VIRGLAAIALRDRGKAARPALAALTAALSDKDPNVRLMSANALAGLGAEAGPAVPALIAAGSIGGEQIQVLRSFVSALGAIGRPAALPAVPFLKDMAKVPRIRWAAEAALANLQ
jgi:HEAT repeat protein